MSRRESRPEASRECVLRPQREQCSSCGKLMRGSYHNRRTVCTLTGLCRLTVVIRCCQNQACERYHVAYHPEEEGIWALPQAEFGLEIIALVGALRYSEHRSIPEIHQQLRLRGVQISERNVTHLVERYEELVALRVQKALDYLQAGDCLVVWKLDRLGRSLPHLIRIVEGFKKKGIAFKSLTEQMDTTTPHGEFFFGIFGSLAQYERALTKERIMAGLTAAKKRGKQGGRPRAISEEKVQAITEALNSGTSKAAICRTFNVKRTTLYDALRKTAEAISTPSLHLERA